MQRAFECHRLEGQPQQLAMLRLVLAARMMLAAAAGEEMLHPLPPAAAPSLPTVSRAASSRPSSKRSGPATPFSPGSDADAAPSELPPFALDASAARGGRDTTFVRGARPPPVLFPSVGDDHAPVAAGGEAEEEQEEMDEDEEEESERGMPGPDEISEREVPLGCPRLPPHALLPCAASS